MACEIKNIHVVTIHSAFGGTLCIGCTIMFLKCNNQGPTLTDAYLCYFDSFQYKQQISFVDILVYFKPAYELS